MHRAAVVQGLMRRLKLREDAGADTQTYALGLREVWQVAPELHKEGSVEHTVGYPLDTWTYGTGYVYHLAGGRVALGLNVGLDYANPHLDPHAEFQRWKSHPHIARLLAGGSCLEFGAAALNQGVLPLALTQVVCFSVSAGHRFVGHTALASACGTARCAGECAAQCSFRTEQGIYAF